MSRQCLCLVPPKSERGRTGPFLRHPVMTRVRCLPFRLRTLHYTNLVVVCRSSSGLVLWDTRVSLVQGLWWSYFSVPVTVSLRRCPVSLPDPRTSSTSSVCVGPHTPTFTLSRARSHLLCALSSQTLLPYCVQSSPSTLSRILSRCGRFGLVPGPRLAHRVVALR